MSKRLRAIRVAGHDSLNSLQGLENGKYWELRIEDNPQLANLDAPAGLAGTTGGRIRITNNGNLENLDGLAGITKVNTELFLIYRPSSLSSLANVAEIEGSLTIQVSWSEDAFWSRVIDERPDYSHPVQRRIGGTRTAYGDSIDGSLHIIGNQSLTSIASLSSVTDFNGGLYIGKNAGWLVSKG